MSSRLPSTQTLQCFEASARLGSFTAAGLELHLTQGGVSRQVLSLEAQLGALLLQRKPSGLQLTPVGAQYLDTILPALRAIEEAGASIEAQRGQASVLNLSIPASWGNYWLIPRLPSLQKMHPQLSVNLFTKVGQADFSQRLIDAAIEFYAEPPKFATDPNATGTTSANLANACEFIMPLSLQPYVSPTWKKQYGDLWDAGDVPGSMLLQHTTLPSAWQSWQANAVIASPVVPNGTRFDLMFMCMNAAVGGSGVALLPGFMTAQLVKTRQLKQLAKTAWRPRGGYYLRASPLLRNSSALRLFAAWLAKLRLEK